MGRDTLNLLEKNGYYRLLALVITFHIGFINYKRVEHVFNSGAALHSSKDIQGSSIEAAPPIGIILWM